MKKLFFFISTLSTVLCVAQNVGIGTTNPTEKLDVNGNVNVNGQLKISGNSGNAGQVLMKDASNNLSWGNLSRFKNVATFDCTSTATFTGGSNCSGTWTVPDLVTEVLVECWGGGGGGGILTGGSSGGYISALIKTSAGAGATITIAAGGNNSSIVSSGIKGGTTSFSLGGISLTATGGGAGLAGDIFTASTYAPPAAGSYSSSTDNSIGFTGQVGHLTKISFSQGSSTDFAKIINYGKGGDSPLFPNSGPDGGYRVIGTTVNTIQYAAPLGTAPGTGAAADASGGFAGRGGRVIIHF